MVECVDSGGRIVWNRPEPWPFTDTDQGTLDPHAHIGMHPALLDRIALPYHRHRPGARGSLAIAA